MKRILIICCLIVFDLFVKLIIFNNFMDNKVMGLNHKFGFVPYHNTEQLSIFNNELGLGFSILLLIIINLAIIICLPIGYRYILKHEYTNKYFDLAYIFMMSGVVCSFIDKVFLKGSLDYILLNKKIIDIKDIYLFIGVLFSIFFLGSYFKQGSVK